MSGFDAVIERVLRVGTDPTKVADRIDMAVKIVCAAGAGVQIAINRTATANAGNVAIGAEDDLVISQGIRVSAKVVALEPKVTMPKTVGISGRIKTVECVVARANNLPRNQYPAVQLAFCRQHR